MRTSTTIKKSSRPRSAAKGFTIIELVMVSIIFALLAGSMIRVSMNSYQKMLTERAARQLFLAARYARIFAVEKQQICRLVISEEDSTFFLIGKFSRYSEETILANTYVKPVELESDITFETVMITPTATGYMDEERENTFIAFHPDGTADAAVLQIGDGRNHYSISISPATGKAKVFDGILEDTPVGIIDLDMVQ